MWLTQRTLGLVLICGLSHSKGHTVLCYTAASYRVYAEVFKRTVKYDSSVICCLLKYVLLLCSKTPSLYISIQSKLCSECRQGHVKETDEKSLR